MNRQSSSQKYFIKGDISGIQDFIFNVKSEKAARVLKARSMFVQILGIIAETKVQRRFGFMPDLKTKKHLQLYNGGGSFYFYLPFSGDQGELEKILRKEEIQINEQLKEEDIYLTISAYPVKNLNDFQDYWAGVNQQSNIDKLRKYADSISSFEPYCMNYTELIWLDFAYHFPKLKSQLKPENTEETSLKILQESIQVLGHQLKLNNDLSQDFFEHKIHNKLPEWRKELFKNPIYQSTILKSNEKGSENPIRSGQIIDYHFLADFAAERSGTRKLAILKMDVDNLGTIFNSMPDKKVAQVTSKQFADFFEIRVNELLDKPIRSKIHSKEDTPYSYRDNVYTIFSGGDDCVFVGAWDTIFTWASLVQRHFNEEVAKNIAITDPQGNEWPISLSAGLVVIDPTYPVIRFAALAEEALNKAKSFRFWDKEFKRIENQPSKNRICVFDEVLSWKAFNQAKDKAYVLQHMIQSAPKPQQGVSKTILERLKHSVSDYRPLQRKALNGIVAGPRVAKLFYYIRHYKEKGWLKDEIIKPYANELIEAFTKHRKINPMKYPVIARWAELLTRDKI